MHARWTIALATLASFAAVAPAKLIAQSKPPLDYDFYRTRVEPIFLKKKAGHTRCVVCHADAGNAFSLEKRPAAGHIWSDQQSRKNFEMTSKLVTPGQPMVSRLLMHPLAPEGGGSVYHSGGRQFASINDPDWKAMAQWVNGATLGAASKKN
jgi:hypothetical protein